MKVIDLWSAATMTKIIKEMLPPDVRVAKDAQDLLVECCVGELFSRSRVSVFVLDFLKTTFFYISFPFYSIISYFC